MSPPAQLTKEHLDMKGLGDALQTADYFGTLPPPKPLAKYRPSLSALSNLSTRGSDVPTPTIPLTTADNSDIPPVDNLISPVSSSSTKPSSVLVDSQDYNTDSPPSSFGSFERVSPPASEIASDVATTGSTTPLPSKDLMPKRAGMMHKVRRSLGWLAGLAS
jgi:hypothetical protein